MKTSGGDTAPLSVGGVPSAAASFNPADREARFTRVSQHAEEIVALADVKPRTAAETEPRKNRYGRMVPQAADAAIEMVSGCAEPFAGLTRGGRTVEDRMRSNAGKAAYLQGLLGKLGEATTVVQGELNATNNELVGDIDDCRQTMVSNLGNPAARGPAQDLLSSSSTKFRGLMDVRNQAFQSSRDTAGGLRDAVKEKESEVADLDLTVARQEVELKFHGGGELTPEDVIIASRPVASPVPGAAPRMPRSRAVSTDDPAPAPRRPLRGRRKPGR